MSLHSRPIPAPKTPAQVSSSSVTTPAARPEPQPEPLSSGTRPSEGDSLAEPSRAPESIAQPAVAGEPSRPWYRSEPWLAVMAVAFVPLLAAVIAPDTAQYPLIGLGVVALVVGIVMLIRQGPIRPHAGSRTHRE